MSETSEDEDNRCPGCGSIGEEMDEGGYSCPDGGCGVYAFGTGEMPGVNGGELA